MTVSDGAIAGLAANAGFPPGEIATAVAIALAESGGRADAVGHNTNGTTDRGLWQINSIHNVSGNVFDPATNAAAAFSIWKASGGGSWRPWSTYNNGSYLAYMGRGHIAAGKPESPTGGGGDVGGAGTPTATGGSPSPLAGAVTNITAGGTWLRVGLFLLGAFLTLIGLVRLTGIGGAAVKAAKLGALI